MKYLLISVLQIPFFGPLIDGMLVSEENLPFLVRSTAIHANAAINSRKPNFKEQYLLDRCICFMLHWHRFHFRIVCFLNLVVS